MDEEPNLVRVPRSLAEVGVLIESLTVAAKAAVDLDAILRRYPWEPLGLRALVLGAGPIGLLSAAMMLVTRNATTFVYSRSSTRAKRVFVLSGMPTAHAPIEIDLDTIMRDIVRHRARGGHRARQRVRVVLTEGG